MDIWKELVRREEFGEELPLACKASPDASSCLPDAEPSLEELDVFSSGFTIRTLTPQMISVWTALQVTSIIVHMSLWIQINQHLTTYDTLIARECAPAHVTHGVCVGPMWNMSTWQDSVLSDNMWSFRSELTFDFSIRSMPPTFLMVVDLASPTKSNSELPEVSEEFKSAHWEYRVTRVDPPGSENWRPSQVGFQTLAFEDLSAEAHSSILQKGRVDWRASIAIKRRHNIRGDVRIVSFVEDANIPHLKEIHESEQCNFGLAWKAFNRQHQGQNHKWLTWCQFFLGLCLPMGGLLTYLVQSLHKQQPSLTNQKFSVNLVMLMKYCVMDIPQQVCIVLYLLGWYERQGLKCQLCLFDPKFCLYDSPYQLVNIVALSCTLCSCMSNQLLVRPIIKKSYTDDDICCHWFSCIAAFSISILPLTCGLWWASDSILDVPMLVHILVLPLCIVGCISLFLFAVLCICTPLMLCAPEESPPRDRYSHDQPRLARRSTSRRNRGRRHRF